MRWVLLVAVMLAPVALAQEAPRKKTAAKKQQQAAHKKPTPEQIRKFNELQKKQKKD